MEIYSTCDFPGWPGGGGGGGGGGFKRCNSHVTAYKSVLKFLQVSVKSITHFKTVIALYMPVLFFKHCHLVDRIHSISVDTYPTDLIRSV